MNKFINRDEEIRLIDDAINTLLDTKHRKRLLQTPVIEFYGVGGIGKTTLLRKVEERCVEKNLSCIWTNAAETLSIQNLELIKKILKEEKPVVVIVDSLDAVGEEHLRDIEAELGDLIENSNLLVVMASKRPQTFENTQSIMRKLTVFRLRPFDQDSCIEYLNDIYFLPPRIRETVYEWTHGYPLAMKIMIEAILGQNLDPVKEQDRKRLCAIITHKVVDQKLLASTNSSNRFRLQTLFTLLAVPSTLRLRKIHDRIGGKSRREESCPDERHRSF